MPATSGLFKPLCNPNNTRSTMARRLTEQLNELQLEGPNLDRVLNQPGINCTERPTDPYHAQCMPLNDNSNLLMDLCGNNRVRDVNGMVGKKSLCPWRYVVKWSNMRLPRKVVEAQLVNDAMCRESGRRCKEVMHVSPTLWMTNPDEVDERCTYSLRYERVVVGYACTLRTA